MNERNDRRAQRTVSFFSDDLIALQELDANELAVPLQRLCENLDLHMPAQLKRIEANPILASGLSWVPADDRRGQVPEPYLRVDLVPLWLATLTLYDVGPSVRDRFELYQRECASVLWQAFKPQGFSPQDALVPPTLAMSASEQAYQVAAGMAVLARQQMMIERQLNSDRSDRDEPREKVIDPETQQIARAVRVVAHSLAMRSRRNEYGGVYQGLYRQFGITSYRDMPRGRFVEAMEWLDRWRGDIEGEPEPPPDI